MKDANVTEAIAASRAQQTAVGEFGEELADACDQLTAAFNLTLDGHTFNDVPASLAPQVRAEAAAIATGVGTVADGLQAWLDETRALHGEGWADVVWEKGTAALPLTFAQLLAEARSGATDSVVARIAHATRPGSATSAEATAALRDTHALMLRRMSGLRSVFDAVDDAFTDLKAAGDAWRRDAPRAAELKAARGARDAAPADRDAACRFDDLVARRGAARTALFESYSSTAEKVRTIELDAA